MSKLVDDPVSDYFSLLLHDPTVDEMPASEPLQHIAMTSLPQHEPIVDAVTYAPAERESQLNQQALTALLAPVSVAQELENNIQPQVVDAPAVTPIVDESIIAMPVDETAPTEDSLDVDALKPSVINNNPATAVNITEQLLEQLDEEFQVLFFQVAGLTLAVPLVSLGTIVNLGRINHLVGRATWYMGVQQHRNTQLNVVDTCAWVMPEKYDDNLAQAVDYKYIVVLKDSNWGLTCESLVNTVKINKSQVNWRHQAGKRPWLAGVVKEQMCGILSVDALIEMLDAGLGCQG
ncbi:chemotaxis protein CheW [Shewanella youngdeokensis]|uniref:Chemotaxis protein CheW n=1 Tax=Shewanella youngdeokensis TaxID=2999068 RepID=A0ABZ0K146_9GAMM|nr:chemotaxis protein CheW [Shewanella sp. DAU334]